MFFSNIPNKILNIDWFRLFDGNHAVLFRDLIFCKVMQLFFENNVMGIVNGSILIDVGALGFYFFLNGTFGSEWIVSGTTLHTGTRFEHWWIVNGFIFGWRYRLFDARHLKGLFFCHQIFTSVAPEQMVLLLWEILETFTNDSLINPSFINIWYKLIFSFSHIFKLNLSHFRTNFVNNNWIDAWQTYLTVIDDICKVIFEISFPYFCVDPSKLKEITSYDDIQAVVIIDICHLQIHFSICVSKNLIVNFFSRSFFFDLFYFIGLNVSHID